MIGRVIESAADLGVDDQTLREIVEGTAGETGERFFDALVQHLARAARTKCAWVTEWLEETGRLRALSFWVRDHYVEEYEYAVPGTPCERVVCDRNLVLIRDRVLELYPRDPDLAPLGAVSYLGLPLLDSDGELLGHLAVLHDAPIEHDPQLIAVFRIFAARAAAELRRIRRDRALREREAKLSLFIDSAMDAILELDEELRITRMNAAAERVFAGPSAAFLGSHFLEFLSDESRGKLAYLIAALGDEAAARPAMWIPDGIEARRRTGQRFIAEATLSRFDVDRRRHYSLIMRDVGERRAAEQQLRALMQETEYLRARLDEVQGFADIVGESEAIRGVLADIERVAKMDTTVLIIGETGTGKELVARAIHRHSARSERPLVAVNCAAIAATLQDSELFGHERGAFTGATQRRDGRFKIADRATLFLDEVGEMSLDLQAKVLRVLQEGEFEPVGSTTTVRVDVRLICATNRDLAEMVRRGTFRADLLYRLDVFPIRIPPLRERGDDVLLLAEAFARRLAKRHGRQVAPLTDEQCAQLKRYDWPGNVRELHNVIERAFITSEDGVTLNLSRALPVTARAPAVEAPDRVLTVDELRALERRNIERALQQANGRLSGPGGAAQLLGLNPNTLASRMKALGLRASRPERR